MKILIVTNLYPPHFLGGYELICAAVVTALRARGHDVHVLTSNHKVAKAAPAPDVNVERKLLVHGFYGHPWLNIVKLRNLEIHNNQILRESLDRLKPDLVYVWNMGGISKSLLLTLQRRGIPTAFYLSDHWIARGLTADVWLRWWNTPDAGAAHKILRTVWTAIGARKRWDALAPTDPIKSLEFRRVYFCSKALRELTADAGFNVMHGSIIYCPVDIDIFHGPVKPASQPMKRLLYVGRLAEDKGVMTALRAMEMVKGQFEGELSIFGKGDAPYTEQLVKFVKERQLPVVFASTTQQEMPNIYRTHDALLFTSEWAEPFALTPLEAMSSGMPVIGTTTGGSRELFRHGENALTYKAGDPKELADRILTLARDPSLRARIAEKGQMEVRSTYSEPVTVDKIEEFLTETVDLWRSPRVAEGAVA